MKERPAGRDIPAAELEVLDALWRRGSATVRDVLEDLEGGGRRLAYNTVLTLLGRLERRGCVGCRREGQANVYRARVTREQVTADRFEPLVRGLPEGQAVPLLLRLVEAGGLSPGDIRSLRKLLTDLEDEAERKGEQ